MRARIRSFRVIFTTLFVFLFLLSLLTAAPFAKADDESGGEIRQKTAWVSGEGPVFDNQGIPKQESGGNEPMPQPVAEIQDPPKSTEVIPDVTSSSTQWKSIYFEGFEALGIPYSAGGWNVYEYTTADICWDDEYISNGALTASGSWSIWPAGGCANALLPSGGGYVNNMATEVIYGPFSLVNYSNARMEFYYNSITETGYDYFCYGASKDGTNWAGECVSGNSGGWLLETVDLKPYVGDSTVWVSFYFASDYMVSSYQGTFVDNIHFMGSQVATFTSNKTQDGWVLESKETSNKGGTKNATEKYLRVGDDDLDRQYRSIVSFNTAALPDGATITRAVLKLKVHSFVGNNTFSDPTLDVRTGTFGAAALELTDFQSAPTASSIRIGQVFWEPGNWMTLTLGYGGYAAINKYGTTQLRIRLYTDDNDDKAADYWRFYSANADAKYAPKLVITYTVP